MYDDISGIAFKNNRTNHPINPDLSEGFKVKKMRLVQDKNGLLDASHWKKNN